MEEDWDFVTIPSPKIGSVHDFALHRQLITWDFSGDPSVYMAGHFVRLEAGWPVSLAERDIPLASLGQYPKGKGHWIVGKNKLGRTITMGVSDAVPHYLFGGCTGSGKTWSIQDSSYE